MVFSLKNTGSKHSLKRTIVTEQFRDIIFVNKFSILIESLRILLNVSRYLDFWWALCISDQFRWILRALKYLTWASWGLYWSIFAPGYFFSVECNFDFVIYHHVFCSVAYSEFRYVFFLPSFLCGIFPKSDRPQGLEIRFFSSHWCIGGAFYIWKKLMATVFIATLVTKDNENCLILDTPSEKWSKSSLAMRRLDQLKKPYLTPSSDKDSQN